jgi:hypothetical protein
VLAGKGEGQKAMQIGLAEATVLLKKAATFGDPRLYALSVVAERLAHSTQPLVPERVFVNGGEKGGQTGLVGTLLDLLVAEKSGFALQAPDDPTGLKEYGERMSKEALEALANGADR